MRVSPTIKTFFGALGVLGVALVCVAPAGAAIPSGNLLANPGAEDGPGATNSIDSFQPPGWQTAPPLTAVAYGTEVFPSLADSASYGGGANFFAGGPDPNGPGISVAYQTLDVSVAAPEIDAGGVQATLAAFLGGFGGQEDNMQAFVVFLDANGAGTSATQIGPVTAADRNSTTGLIPQSATIPVAPSSRSAFVYLYATRDSGTYNDGYADNVSMTLSPAAPPPEPGEQGTASAVEGRVLICEKGAGGCRELTGTESIPVGSVIDATEGRVRLTTATKAGGTDTTDFYDGQFRFDQKRTGLVTASLGGADFGSCGSREDRAGKKLARLWGNGRGRTRTKGRRGSGTVRGTIWLTEERCNGTYFEVEEGRLKVRDFARKKNVTLRAGDSYLARAPR